MIAKIHHPNLFLLGVFTLRWEDAGEQGTIWESQSKCH